MLTLQWSRIYWSQMICVQFYLLSLFVWWAISVAVCLIVGFLKPHRSCNEDKYSPWIHSPCFMINTFTPDHFSNMIISHHFTFSEVLFLCCLLTDWALVLMEQCRALLYCVMHVNFTVFCLINGIVMLLITIKGKSLLM